MYSIYMYQKKIHKPCDWSISTNAIWDLVEGVRGVILKKVSKVGNVIKTENKVPGTPINKRKRTSKM
jgi:hypothetical protein